MYGTSLARRLGAASFLALSLLVQEAFAADPLAPATHVATASTARPTAQATVGPALRPSVHAAAPRVPGSEAHPTASGAAAQAQAAKLGGAVRLSPAPARERIALVPPPHAGYAQHGSSETPWGEARTLAPHGEEKRLWRIVNRLNPGYARDGNDRFVSSAPDGDPRARHINCVLASLSFEDSMLGHPTVALPGWGWKHVSTELYEAKLDELGADFAESYTTYGKESVLYATRYPGVKFDQADDFHVLAQRLVSSGEGSRMVLLGRWTDPDGSSGLHAINMVNLRGNIVVADAQSGRLSTPETYFGESTWTQFRYHVTAEGAPGKSPFEGDTPVIRLGQPATTAKTN